jgi:hypothetical protein
MTLGSRATPKFPDYAKTTFLFFDQGSLAEGEGSVQLTSSY